MGSYSCQNNYEEHVLCFPVSSPSGLHAAVSL